MSTIGLEPAWYSFLILQPYLIAKADYARHRTYGIIGIFLAGGVCLTALSMLNRDIVNSQRAAELPERFGPFQPWFFYGVAAVEPVMMLAFGYAVMMAIIHRDEIENHAWWLISTVFLIMMPALGRGIQNLYIAFNFKDWPNVDIMFPLYLTQFIILALLLLGAWKYKKLSHPATYLAVAVNIFILLIEPLGRSTNVQAFLNAVFKG
jgi:hypothetical protein